MAPQFRWLECQPVTLEVVGSKPIGVARPDSALQSMDTNPYPVNATAWVRACQLASELTDTFRTRKDSRSLFTRERLEFGNFLHQSVSSRMTQNVQVSLCQATWPVGCERISLLDGCNTTCKALKISDIIKGIRGKREFKGFKAIVNSLKTTQGLRESVRSTGGSRIFLAAGYVG